MNPKRIYTLDVFTAFLMAAVRSISYHFGIFPIKRVSHINNKKKFNTYTNMSTHKQYLQLLLSAF